MKKLVLLLVLTTPFVLNAQCGDTTPPTGTAPPDVSVQCIGDVPAADPTLITDEADNVTPNPTVTHISDVSDGNTCPETISRTYRIEDDCGNFIDVTQTITVNDVTPPTASNPATIYVSCATDVPAPDVTVVTDESDNCTAAPIVSFTGQFSDGNICNSETIQRSYSVTDDCGNQITVTQTIVIDAVAPSVDAGIDQESCEGEMVILNGTGTLNGGDNLYTTWDQGVVDGVPFNPGAAGTYSYTYTASVCGGGCQSSDIMQVTVHPAPDTSVVQNFDTLSAVNSSATYQWVDCNNNYSIISGATNQEYITTSNGSYAVIVTGISIGCSDTSSCYSIADVGINDNNSEKLHIYPHPATDQLTMEFSSDQSRTIYLLDISGKILTSVQSANSTEMIDVSQFESGVYIIQVSSSEGILSRRLLIE